MNWLTRALGFCKHKWDIIEQFSVNRSLDGRRVATMYVLRCEHCGSIKRKRV